jgi:hypothetical protein
VKKWFKWIKRSFVILLLYGIGIAEGYYLPRYGIEWLLGGIGQPPFSPVFGYAPIGNSDAEASMAPPGSSS